MSGHQEEVFTCSQMKLSSSDRSRRVRQRMHARYPCSTSTTSTTWTSSTSSSSKTVARPADKVFLRKLVWFGAVFCHRFFFGFLSGTTSRTCTSWTPSSPGNRFGPRLTFDGSCWSRSFRYVSVRYNVEDGIDQRRREEACGWRTRSHVCRLVLGVLLPGG